MNINLSFAHHLLLGFALLIVAACQPPADGESAIRNVTIIDAVHGVRRNQTVVFEADRIIDVVASSKSVRVEHEIDGSGKFLIPGLWDMHVHLTFDARLTEAMPKMFLQQGITSVRDTGGLMRNMLPIVTTMRAEGAVAPRVFFSGPLMDGEYVVYDGQSVPEIGIQNSDPKSAVANVAALKESGVDFIKIYEMVTPEVLEAISKAARENDLPITGHVPLSMTATTTAPFVDSLEHLRNIELDCAINADELLETRLQALENDNELSGHALRSQMHSAQRVPAFEAFDKERCDAVMAALRNVIQVPTSSLNTLALWPPWERADWDKAIQPLPEDVRQEWQTIPGWFNSDEGEASQEFAQNTLKLIGAMNAAGVPIGAGTDTPIARAIPGDSLHSELEVLVEAGLTPIEAIEAATIRPAEFFGLESNMGVIKKGMVADMVLLDADPLLDIRNTRAIDAVIYRGRLLESSNN